PFHGEATRKLISAFDPARDFQAANTTRTLDPRTLALELEKLLPQDRNIVVDGGNFLGVVPYLNVPDPGCFKMIGDFASIGLGFGTALGVAKARPDKTTVLVVGDGGFLMTMGELETVVREDLPIVIVLMNDCAYGAELHFLRLRQQPVAKSVFPDVDFAPIAEERHGVGICHDAAIYWRKYSNDFNGRGRECPNSVRTSKLSPIFGAIVESTARADLWSWPLRRSAILLSSESAQAFPQACG